MSAVRWFFGTKAKYEALKNANQLHPEGMYLLTDTNEYYYKDVNYMCNVVYFSGDLPSASTASQNRIYFNTTTLTAYTSNGSTWDVLIEPAKVGVLISGTNTGVPQMVTGAAAKAYIDEFVTTNNNNAVIEISWDATNSKIKYRQYVNRDNTTTTDLTVNEFGASITRNASTGDISILGSDGTTVLATINIPLDNYVVSGIYDNTRKAIVFTMSNGADVLIYAADIIKLYNRVNTSSITTNIITSDGLNFIEMNVNISAVSGNELYLATVEDGNPYINPREGTPGTGSSSVAAGEEGLYVSYRHLIDFLTPVTTQSQVMKLDAVGAADTTAHTIGSATLNATQANQASIQATEECLTNTQDTILTNLTNTYVPLSSVRTQYSNFAEAFKTIVYPDPNQSTSPTVDPPEVVEDEPYNPPPPEASSSEEGGGQALDPEIVQTPVTP